MKIVLALALFTAVAHATIVPRNIRIPTDQLNPRYTRAEWAQVLANQEFTPEVVENFQPGTAPQDDGAGSIHADVKIDPRIIGGATATRGQFPWQVSVTMDSSYFCGGSIISKDWVLTAGHCVEGISSFRLVFGTNTPDGGASGSVAQTSRTKILHADYNSRDITNDIGLIKLATPLTWSTYIGATRLPAKSEVGNTFVGQTARISGWGLTSDNAGSISSTLQWVDLKIISNQVCIDTYGSSILASVICTSSAGGKNICSGDSGGPLCIQGGDGLWTEIGIVSFGAAISCELPYPAGFTRVTSFLSWIESNTGITIRA